MAAKDFRHRSDKPDGSKKAKADWRGKGKSGTGSRLKRAKSAAWAEKTGDEFKHAKLRYRLKIGAWLAILIALVGVFVAYVLWRPGYTPFLAMTVTRYGDEMAGVVGPNAWAREDVERFRELGDATRVLKYSLVPYATEEAKVDGLKNLRRNLLAAKRGGPEKNLVVVYLSMHGAVDGDGRPCLLPPDASPYDADTWLPMEEVIGYLFPKDKLDRLPEKKLLILDCNRMDVNWRLGLLYNDFADRLKDVFERAEVPGLMILNSTSPGEVGWSSAGQFQGSVFAHYLYRGLCGEADDDGNNRISLSELHAYLEAGVGQWARGNRSDRQRPMLLTAEVDDVELVFNRKHQPTAGPIGDLKTSSRWAEVARFWTEYHKPNRKVAPRLRPVLWERFQSRLLRLERLLLAGSAYEDEFSRVSKEVRDLAEQLGEDGLPGRLAAYSLPLARQLDRVPAGESVPDRQAYLEAAEVSWARILAQPGGAGWAEQLQAVDAARGQGIDVVELHFARMLNRHLDPDTWRDNPRLVRLALSARQLAERVAAPPDDTNDLLLSQRAHYWTSRSIDGADQERRLAEDRLFIGGPNKLETVPGLYAKIGTEANEGRYGEAGKLGEKVCTAYELRDRARATAPYLAQWLFARLSHPESSELDDLAELIRATGELEAELEASLAAAAWRAELDPLTSLVAGKLDALRDSFDRECSALEDAGLHDPETLKGISVVLGTPLVTGASRMLLMEKLLRADSERGEGGDSLVGSGARGDDRATDKKGAEPGDEPIRLYAKRLEAYAEHPAVALLGNLVTEAVSPAVEATEEFNARVVFYQPGQTVRKSLASLDGRLGKLPRELEEILRASGDAPRSPAEARAGLAEADQLVRAAAPFAAQRKTDYRREVVAEPAVLLRRLDLHYLLLWHCHRTLDDFWGPADEQRARPYFEFVAREYLDSAGELVGSTARASRGKIDLEALLEARSKAVLRPRAENLQVDDDEFARPAELKVSVMAGRDLPRGEAAIYLSDSAGEGTIPILSAEDLEEPDLRRFGVEVIPASGSDEGGRAVPRHWVANKSLADHTKRLNAIALYRGHRVPCPVVVERLGLGIPIEYVPRDYSDPTVTVFGEAMRKSSVMFVLDCSGSMDEKMVTADDTRTTTTSRFIEAKMALGVILSELADSEDSPYQVGVLVYGHRVGWKDFGKGLEQATWNPEVPVSKSPRGERIRKERVEGGLPHPNMDIEQIWPLSRFSEFERRSLKARLDELRPLGETPLYLSIIEAASRLRKGNTPVNHIIAITDGVNDRSDVDADEAVLPSHVQEAIGSLGAGKVRLDIVAINTNDKDIEQHLNGLMANHTPAQREEELRVRIGRRDDLIELADSTGGKFYPADDPDRLLAALKESLQLSRYEVVKLPGGTVVDTKSLGKKSRIEQALDAEVDYLVRVPDREHTAQSKITLLGGEGLELYLNRSANRLEHRRFFDQQRAAGRKAVEEVINPLGSDDSEPVSLFVGAHLPAREGDSVRFGVSVQNQDETAFSPRPVEAWVQITPLVSGKESVGDYVFYDPVFVEGRPVPIIECVAPRWPVEAGEAQIRMFCKFQATDPKNTDVIAVDELAARGRYTVDGLSGIGFSLEKRRGESGRDYRIVVMERHTAGSKLDSAKVVMYPPPKRTVHRFRQKTAEVYHTFYYDDAAAEGNKIGGYRVIISPRSGLSENAISPSKPLVVRIPD
jgi:hypothetical protein